MDFFLTFVGGLLGSSHCIGMCGGFALAIGAGTSRWRVNLVRQSLYTAGRVTTYTLAGAMAGYGGLRLASSVSSAMPVHAILALAAGALLTIQGLFATGILRRRVRGAAATPCLVPKLFGAFLHRGGWRSVFIAGVLTGLLPCGLVYAFLALASTTENMLEGGLRMALFGLGTAPLMMLTGLGGSALKLAARRRALTAAGWCVVLAGILSIWRGVGFLQTSYATDHAACPFCSQTDR
jgi:sulfite exporter TauE/SafE